MTTLREAAQQALEAWEYINKYGFVLADYEGPMEQAITALKAALEQPEQPEQELKLLNGLTKEEALAWARGLRADSPEYCSCGDRPKGHCPGEWDPGCDLGNNPKYARRVELQCPAEQKESATIPIQEAWEAAGGHPGIKATKEDLIFALQTLNQVCDEADQLAPYNGANEKPPVFGRRWRLAHDGFGLQLDDNGPYVHIDDAISVLHTSLEQPVQEPVAWWIVSKTTDEEFVSVRPNDWSDINWEKHPIYTHPPRREWRGLTEEEIKGYKLCGLVRDVEAKLKEKNHHD